MFPLMRVSGRLRGKLEGGDLEEGTGDWPGVVVERGDSLCIEMQE